MTEIPQDPFSRILGKVNNPASYLGTEMNAVRKNPAGLAASIALAFPDRYDIGMSHLGLKILYGVINSENDLAAERVFAPGEDFAAGLMENRLKLMSLETRRPLAAFDFLGFTIPYELSYTTILWMLDLAGIPLRAENRAEDHPLVIGGGAGVYNPEPVAPFFDLFFLGEAEKALPEIMRAGAKGAGKGRKERLKFLAAMEGVYVPSMYDVRFGHDGLISSVNVVPPAKDKPVKVPLKSLSESPFPEKLVVPFGRPAHDRLNVEIDRGCTQGCRFCQAGSTYRPARERTPEEVCAIFEKAMPATGYGDICLTSLSAGDYSHMEELLTALMDKYSGGKVSVSLPSLRPGSVTTEVIEQIKRVRRTGFTITAEAGTQRLRNVINKKVADEEIEKLALALLENKWRSLKLYFMIGLPTETEEDVRAIVTLAARLASLKAEDGSRFANITVNVSNFVPKAHTAFQWAGQDLAQTLEEKKELLFSLIRPHKKIRFKWTDPKVSRLEAAFSRGSRRLAEVVEKAYSLGARLDAWTESRDFNKWDAAFRECGVNPDFYAARWFGPDEILPWDHLDTGLSRDYFRKELELALKGEVTGDCKVEKCLLCGLDPKTCFKPYVTAPAPAAPPKIPGAPPARFIYRLTFHKKETGKYHSHLETMAIIKRAFRASALPVANSEGFHPQPRISFGPALPVGVESAEELLDVELTGYREPWVVSGKLNSRLPEGFHFVNARQIRLEEKSISSSLRSVTFRVKLEGPPPAEDIQKAVGQFMQSGSAPVVRPGKEKPKDIRPMVTSLLMEPQSQDIIYTTAINQTGGFARPDEVALALFPDGAAAPARMVKLSCQFD